MDTADAPGSGSRLRDRIQLVRRDIGNLLFHFTHRTTEADAYSVLLKILREGSVLGSSHWIRGGRNCVCFTEAPMSELAAIFSLARIAADQSERPRYEPFGVAVEKRWLYDMGGRPVVYQSEKEFKHLPQELQWRHVRYEPERGIDHTWEREWRIRTESLKLDPSHTLFVVPTAQNAFELTYGFSDVDHDYDWPDESPTGAYHVPRWLAVSLDLFGVGMADLY